jgi:pyrroloquinoline-quinone synthase
MTISVDGVLQEVEAIHQRKPRFGHPLWTEFCDGKLSKEQVKAFAKQNGIIPLYNHNYHGRLYVICPDPQWRARIVEVCYEEATGRLYAGGVGHNELYLRYGEALGISRDEMWNADYCAGALAFKAYFSEVCGRDFLEGVSAHMLAAEGSAHTVTNAHGSRRADALIKYYGLTDEGVRFFTVHQSADEDHTSIGRELLGHFAKTDDDVRRVLKTVEETLDLMLLMYDDMYRLVKAI